MDKSLKVSFATRWLRVKPKIPQESPGNIFPLGHCVLQKPTPACFLQWFWIAIFRAKGQQKQSRGTPSIQIDWCFQGLYLHFQEIHLSKLLGDIWKGTRSILQNICAGVYYYKMQCASQKPSSKCKHAHVFSIFFGSNLEGGAMNSTKCLS